MSVEEEETVRIIEAIQSGSVAAFDQFYENYKTYVYQLAFSMTKTKEEAEDLCHDVFVEVFRKAGSYHTSRGSVKAWLAVKTKSRFIDRKRKSKRVLPQEDIRERLHSGQSTDGTVLAKWERETVKEAIGLLPSQQRQALYGKYFEYKTQKEIAGELDKPMGTVKSLLRYGLKNLKIHLEAFGVERGEPRHDDSLRVDRRGNH